jgi:hygromycin-B 4-O-kinase
LVIRFGRHVDDFSVIDWRPISPLRSADQVIEIDKRLRRVVLHLTRSRGTPLEQLDVAGWQATVPAVLATLDALRRTDISATSGYGSWDAEGKAEHATWAEYLASVMDDLADRRTRGWKRRLVDSSIGDESFCRAFDVMVDLAGTVGVDRHLVHNDLLNRNVLASEGQVTAVFDWGCSIYGDFLYELATFVFWAPWHSAIEQSEMLSVSVDHYRDMGLDLPDLEARLRCCLLHIGLVHLAYNAFLGDEETLRATDRRLARFIDGTLFG